MHNKWKHEIFQHSTYHILLLMLNGALMSLCNCVCIVTDAESVALTQIEMIVSRLGAIGLWATLTQRTAERATNANRNSRFYREIIEKQSMERRPSGVDLMGN